MSSSNSNMNVDVSKEITNTNTFFARDIFKDEGEIIKLDVRGKIIKVYKSTLLLSNSPVFANLIGVGQFKQNKQQEDGTYFIDCDVDVFRHVLAFIESGIFPTKKYDPIYLKFICDKFCIDMEIKTKTELQEEHRLEKEKEMKKQKEVVFSSLRNFIEENTKEYFQVRLKFIKSIKQVIDIIKQGNDLKLKINSDLYRDIYKLCASNFLLSEYFGDVKKRGYEKEVSLIKRQPLIVILFAFNKKYRSDNENDSD